MSAIAQRRVAGATALMILLYLLQVALFAPNASAEHDVNHVCDGADYAEFTFVFLNGTTISGDNCPGSEYEKRATDPGNRKNEVFFPGTGGNYDYLDPEAPGMLSHVSCSEIFFGGWATESSDRGPSEVDDPNWQIAEYSIQKYQWDAQNVEHTTGEQCAEKFWAVDVLDCTENGTDVTVTVSAGTRIVISDDESVIETVLNGNTSGEITSTLSMTPGDYTWQAFEGETALNDPTPFTVPDCSTPVASVSVTAGCDESDQFVVSWTTSNATIEFYTLDGETKTTVTLTSGSAVDLTALPDGTVIHWDASATGDAEFAVDATTSGSFTVDDCVVTTTTTPPPSTVQVAANGVCTTNDAGTGVGRITVSITPAGGATVTVGGRVVGNGETIEVDDETTYTVTVSPNGGAILTGDVPTEVAIGDCPDDVEVLGTTITTVPEVSADTLPFTGSESGDMVKLAMLALLAGALMLFAVRGPKEEEEIATEMGGWSDL